MGAGGDGDGPVGVGDALAEGADESVAWLAAGRVADDEGDASAGKLGPGQRELDQSFQWGRR